MNHMTPFELIIGDESGEILNGDIPVRWCISPKLVAQMEKDGIEDPHIVIVTTINDNEEWNYPTEMSRHLEPLSALMTYVRFTRAGPCEIHAWIVDGKKGRKNLKSRLFNRGDDYYIRNLVYSSGESNPNISMLYQHTWETVEIPAGVFGKEPSGWIKWFANLWHSNSKVVDECHFRRRMILAFTLKWIPVSIYALGEVLLRTLIATMVTLFGWRPAVRWKYVIRPFDFPVLTILNEDKLKLWLQDFLLIRDTGHKSVSWQLDNDKQFHVILLPFTPIFVLLMWFISSLIATNFTHSMIILSNIMMFAGAVAVIVDVAIWLAFTLATLPNNPSFDALMLRLKNFVLFPVRSVKRADLWIGESGYGPGLAIVLAIGLLIGFGWLVSVMWEVFLILGIGLGLVIGAFLLIDRYMNNKLRENDYTEIRELLCPADTQNLIPKREALPVEHRSIKLWYLETKNKVCKPMQM